MPSTIVLTPELLSMLAGALLSLLFSYAPGVRDWWAQRTAETKSLVMLGLLLLVSVGVVSASCGGLIAVVVCSQNGVLQVVWTFVLSLMANQSTYKISPQLKSAAVQAPKPTETVQSPFVQEPQLPASAKPKN